MRQYEYAVWITSRPGRFLSLEWHDDDGKRRCKSTKTNDPEKAERLRSDHEYELNHGLYAHPSRMTWSAFLERYRIGHLNGQRPRTIEKAETVFDVFAQEFRDSWTPETLRLCDVDCELLETFANKLRRRPTKKNPDGFAAFSIRNYLSVLKTALTWAADPKRKILSGCPVFPRIKVPKFKPRPMPAEAWERYFDSLTDAAERAMSGLGWWAGLRLSEAHELRRTESEKHPWVDFSAGRLVLPAAFVKAVEDQFMPLHPKLRDLLLRVPRIEGMADRFFLLRNFYTGEPLTRAGLSRRFAYRAHQAGIRASHHSFRKGFISRVAKRHAAQVTQQLARHASINTTMDFYANVDDVLKSAVEAID